MISFKDAVSLYVIHVTLRAGEFEMSGSAVKMFALCLGKMK